MTYLSHADYTAPAYIRTSVAEAVERLERPSLIAVSTALVDASARFDVMRAEEAAHRSSVNAFFDGIRDRALLRRDVNEALECVVMEALGEIA
jgi:hypothetical protein